MRVRLGVFVLVLLTLGLPFILVACSESTGPDTNTANVSFDFSPVVQGVAVQLGQTVEFSVSSVDVDTMDVNWWRGGEIRSHAMQYTYVPSMVGIDTLRVQVAAGEFARNYYWVVTISAADGVLPPVVPGVGTGPGPSPGDVVVDWNRLSGSVFPLAEYVVAISNTGPLDEGNWASSLGLRHVQPRVGRLHYQETFSAATESFEPGMEVWGAVRAVDTAGQMSPVGVSRSTVVTAAWWLTGRVRDDLGVVPPVVVVESLSPPLATNVEATTGTFRLGPFRSIDSVELVTASSNAQGSGWFDFQTGSIDSSGGRDVNIVLIKRHELAPACGSEYGWQFLNYVRTLTQTAAATGEPGNTVLHRWNHYPLHVYLSGVVNPAGVDFAVAGRLAMAFWDSVMAEPYFVETTDPNAAQVVFTVDGTQPSFYGRVRLLEPAGPLYHLGNVVPEVVEVYLLSTITDPVFAKGVALHELGHVLGLLGHATCTAANYLMTAGNGSAFDNVEPIHPDEQNAVRCVRRLGQGVDMSGYSLN